MAFPVLLVGEIASSTNSNAYGQIPDRNLFDLKQPAPAPPPKAPEASPQLRLILTGITTILGDKRALIKAVPQSGGSTNETSFILSEGQREGFLEILQIDENAGSVALRNSGREMTLTLAKDGPRLPSTPAPAPGLTNIAPPSPVVPAYAVNPQPTNALPTVGSVRSLPSRSRRGLPAQGGAEVNDTGALAEAAAAAALAGAEQRVSPPIPVPVPVPVPGTLNSTPTAPVPAEEQNVIQDAQAEAARGAAAASIQRRTLPMPPGGYFPPTPSGSTAVPGTPPPVIPPGQ